MNCLHCGPPARHDREDAILLHMLRFLEGAEGWAATAAVSGPGEYACAVGPVRARLTATYAAGAARWTFRDEDTGLRQTRGSLDDCLADLVAQAGLRAANRKDAYIALRARAEARRETHKAMRSVLRAVIERLWTKGRLTTMLGVCVLAFAMAAHRELPEAALLALLGMASVLLGLKDPGQGRPPIPPMPA